jgi:hypothetical protein
MFHVGLAPPRPKGWQRQPRTLGRMWPRPTATLTKLDLTPKQLWYIKPTASALLNRSTTAANAIFWLKIITNPDAGAFTLSPSDIEELIHDFRRNKGMRHTLRGFLRRWMLSRFKIANTHDPITCEIPKNVIQVTDWDKRTKYVFEARPFFKNIMTQLTNQEFLFPGPVHPTNMFTNEPFTADQFFAINAQLTAAGLNHWIWGAFSDLKYSLANFKTTFDLPLRTFILNDVFSKKRSDVITDVVLDFIEAEAESHDIIRGVPYRILRWALEHEYNHPYIETWRELCYDYYDITTLNNRKKSLIIIRAKSLALLQMQVMWKDLNREHSYFIQNQRRQALLQTQPQPPPQPPPPQQEDASQSV